MKAHILMCILFAFAIGVGAITCMTCLHPRPSGLLRLGGRCGGAATMSSSADGRKKILAIIQRKEKIYWDKQSSKRWGITECIR